MATPSQLDQVRQAIASNPALKQRLARFPSASAAVPELVKIAAEMGVTVTEAEVNAALQPPARPQGELSDAELATVAGGTNLCWETTKLCWNTDTLSV